MKQHYYLKKVKWNTVRKWIISLQENKNTSVDSINIIDETENVIDESNKMSQEEFKESSESNEIASDYTDLEELLLG